MLAWAVKRSSAARLWKLTFATAVLLLVAGAALATPAQDLVERIRQMDVRELREKLPELEARFPGNPVVLYIKGMLSEDGETALGYYEKLLEKHPESRLAPDAALRICQYYFAKGLYTTCRSHCAELLRKWPNSKAAETAEYLLASSFFAAGQFDSAYVRLRRFVERHPTSPLLPLVKEDLASFRDRARVVTPGGGNKPLPAVKPRPKPAQPSPSAKSEKPSRFAVQVGAFRSKSNALRQKKILEELGYLVRVVEKERNGKRLWAVWVGDFAEYRQAHQFGEELQSRLGIPYRVVSAGEM
ncbi:MAG: tetratricopeptide repeat protein [Calditrichaeota bacterium]|nr:tetratricopeptide repeat protein [Calditrichota bacterium]